MRVVLVAGEPSGDLLGAALIESLRARMPGATFAGVGGPAMRAAGLDGWHPMDLLSVRGYVEVLRRVPALLRLRRELAARVVRERPDVFIGIDAPDFNLALEGRVRAAGIRTLHYVCPSIWAWRAERVRQLRTCVDHVLAVFPFEVPLLERHGIAATYVGHPLADRLPIAPDRMAVRDRLQLAHAPQVIALLPGSREAEVEAMAGSFIETALLLHARLPGARFLMPMVNRRLRERVEAEIYARDAHALPLQLLFGHAHSALAAADVALVASGTATLEAALLRCPMVVTYRMPDWSWRIMRRRGYLAYGGLPNILAGRFVVPELIQEHATPVNLAQALANLIADAPVRQQLETLFGQMHETLRQGSAQRVADAVQALVR
ncbi:MAG: lipid-A-disaccharide synthase [Pseudomonadota bacterium]|jgi:lipid-A-disaccharide synthase